MGEELPQRESLDGIKPEDVPPFDGQTGYAEGAGKRPSQRRQAHKAPSTRNKYAKFNELVNEIRTLCRKHTNDNNLKCTILGEVNGIMRKYYGNLGHGIKHLENIKCKYFPRRL